jgi:hypothetical protein
VCTAPEGFSWGTYDGYGTCEKRGTLGSACGAWASDSTCPAALVCRDGVCQIPSDGSTCAP